MERTFISWNFQNWITVVLMVGIAWTAVGMVKSVLAARGGSDE